MKLNLGAIKQQSENEILGFQDEFMAKINEFSESWRQAALREQRH